MLIKPISYWLSKASTANKSMTPFKIMNQVGIQTHANISSAPKLSPVNIFFCSFSEFADSEILERQVLRARFLGLISIFQLLPAVR